MKLPRDVSGDRLVRALRRRFGYQIKRQRGSHVTLETQLNGTFSLPVPMHDPIVVGTLRGILGAIAEHHGLAVGELVEQLEL